MNKTILIAVALAMVMVFSLLPAAASAEYARGEKIADLIAGGGNSAGATDVGDVFAYNDGAFLWVTYVIADASPVVENIGDWRISETHLDIGYLEDGQVKGIEVTKSGSPVPGKFPYSPESATGWDTEVVYKIPVADLPENYVIAAHAVVEKHGGLSGIEALLPEKVGVMVYGAVAGGPSYFPRLDIRYAGAFNGNYSGWCVDTDVRIGSGPYWADVYSSYAPVSVLAGLGFEHPENFDLVNWILNQGYVGKSSVYGTFTYGDVQRAIWELIDDVPIENSLGDWSQARADLIEAAALANGEGFIPGPGQYFTFILIPYEGGCPVQALIAVMRLPCPADETAWGICGGIAGLDDGSNEFAKSWAEYIPS